MQYKQFLYFYICHLTVYMLTTYNCTYVDDDDDDYYYHYYYYYYYAFYYQASTYIYLCVVLLDVCVLLQLSDHVQYWCECIIMYTRTYCMFVSSYTCASVSMFVCTVCVYPLVFVTVYICCCTCVLAVLCVCTCTHFSQCVSSYSLFIYVISNYKHMRLYIFVYVLLDYMCILD